jgi:hypothetical protein
MTEESMNKLRVFASIALPLSSLWRMVWASELNDGVVLMQMSRYKIVTAATYTII